MSLFEPSVHRALDANGNPISGATWTFYLTESTTLAPVYTSNSLNTELSNPVVADSGGKFANIFLDDSVAYRAVLKDAAGTTIKDVDPVNSGGGQVATITPQDFGAVGDGVTDDIDAFEAMIYEAYPDQDVLRIYIPPGNYLLSRQIIPRRQIELVGAGQESTRLTFHNVASANTTMKGMLAFGLASTLTAYTTNPESYPVAAANEYTAGGAHYSQVRDLAIFITGTRPSGLHYGIWVAATMTLQNVHVHNGGFKFIGGNLIVGSGAVTGNANMCRVLQCRSFHSTEDSFFTDGDDVNACSFIGCTAWAPARIGFHDASFLGNLYSGCLREGVQGTTVNGYKSVGTAGVNKSLFNSCYNEGNAMSGPRWNIESPGLIIGWQGVAPERNLGANFNTSIDASNAAGLVTTNMINVAADGIGFNLGSASVRASRLSTDGLLVRGQDGLLYGMMQLGGDGKVHLVRDSADVMLIQKGAAIAKPAGGATVDTEARAAIDAIIDRMRALTPTIDT